MMNEMTNSNQIIQTYTLLSGERDTLDCPQASHIAMITLTKVKPQTTDAMIMSAVVMGSFS